jgi:hypothetical protein
MISNPNVGTYEISVSTGSYLVNDVQSFSLIIGSYGLTFISKVSFPFDTFCGTNQHLVHMTTMDHGGDGWEAGNSYVITKDGVTVASGTMSGSVGDDFLKQSSMCMASGTYEVKFEGSNFDEMGFDIANQVYLSQFDKTGTFFVPPPNCGMATISLLLSGSSYGVPYGWNGQTHYKLKSKNGKAYSGSLVTGITREHTFCIPDGEYVLTLDDVPNDDDFYPQNVDPLTVGVEEYFIRFTVDYNQASIDKDSMVKFRIENGEMVWTGIYPRDSSDDDDDDESTTSSLILIVVLTTVGVAVIFGVIAFIISNKQKRVQAAVPCEVQVEVVNSGMYLHPHEGIIPISPHTMPPPAYGGMPPPAYGGMPPPAYGGMPPPAYGGMSRGYEEEEMPAAVSRGYEEEEMPAAVSRGYEEEEMPAAVSRGYEEEEMPAAALGGAKL